MDTGNKWSGMDTSGQEWTQIDTDDVSKAEDDERCESAQAPFLSLHSFNRWNSNHTLLTIPFGPNFVTFLVT